MAYIAFVIAVAAYFTRHAEYSWDIIPYTAAVVATDGGDAATIHARTYRLVRAAVPAARLPELAGNDYTRAVAADPRALMQQLPFYRIKPAYVLLLRALFVMGVNPAHAAVLVSAAAYVCICLLAWAWLAPILSPSRRWLAAILIALCQPLLHLAGLTNPDALSTAVVVLGFYLYVVRQRAGLALVVLLTSVLVRSDNAFTCAALGGYLAWRDRRTAPRRALLAGASAVAGLSWVVAWHHAVGDYGWRLMMYHSFIQPLPTPADGMPAMRWAQLAKLWFGGLATLRYTPLTLALLVVASAYGSHRRDPGQRDARATVLVLLAALATHFAAFPNLEERFFAAHIVVFVLVGAVWLLAPAVPVVGEAGHGLRQQDRPGAPARHFGCPSISLPAVPTPRNSW